MTFKPGQPRPERAGRKAGTPNRSTQAVREALVEAFERRGGVEYLTTLDDDIFARLLVRLIPNEVSAKLGGVEVLHRIHVGPKPE
jgi:hypothetical protein